MTTPTPERLERKVQQLDNDVQAIYESLARIEGVQRRHTNRFEELDGHLDRVDGRLDHIDGRLDHIDGRLDGIERQIGDMALTLGEVLRRLD